MPLAHAILASLDFQPMSGYDLKKFFDQSAGNFWSATQSHIYKALNELEERGWADKQLIPQAGRPNRYEYSITPTGQEELRRWLTTPLPLAPVREAWLIQIFFSHKSTNAEIAALLQARLAAIRQALAAFRGAAEGTPSADGAPPTDSMPSSGSLPPIPPPGLERAYALWQITADYGAAFYEFDLRWHEQILERVRRLPPLSNPDDEPSKEL
jgi:PadR family transcriptional regulator, regulatory protein AphA